MRAEEKHPEAAAHHLLKKLPEKHQKKLVKITSKDLFFTMQSSSPEFSFVCVNNCIKL